MAGRAGGLLGGLQYDNITRGWKPGRRWCFYNGSVDQCICEWLLWRCCKRAAWEFHYYISYIHNIQTVSPHLFINTSGHKMTQSNVANAINQCFCSSGFKQHVSCTAIRKFAVTHVHSLVPTLKQPLSATCDGWRNGAPARWNDLNHQTPQSSRGPRSSGEELEIPESRMSGNFLWYLLNELNHLNMFNDYCIL